MVWPEGPGVVVFPDGRRVRGRGLRRGDPAAGPVPELGVYLLGRRPPAMPWPSEWIDWPDFRVPRDSGAAVATLREAFERAATQRVEVACGGGVGRTGTALAFLAMLSGVAAEDAVAWTRAHYVKRAVETPWQRRWLRRVAVVL